MASAGQEAFGEWLGDALVFVARTELAADKIAAAGEKLAALWMRSQAGAVAVSSWMWYRKLGGTKEAYDQVMKLARGVARGVAEDT